MNAIRYTNPTITGCYDARVLAAFEHSNEYTELCSQDAGTRYLPYLLELAETLWLTPDDITAPLLLELLHDLPYVCDYEPHDIPDIVNELAAFWSFVGRECQYPHADECLMVLDRDAARALECALGTHPRPFRVMSTRASARW